MSANSKYSKSVPAEHSDRELRFPSLKELKRLQLPVRSIERRLIGFKQLQDAIDSNPHSLSNLLISDESHIELAQHTNQSKYSELVTRINQISLLREKRTPRNINWWFLLKAASLSQYAKRVFHLFFIDAFVLTVVRTCLNNNWLVGFYFTFVSIKCSFSNNSFLRSNHMMNIIGCQHSDSSRSYPERNENFRLLSFGIQEEIWIWSAIPLQTRC